MKKKATGNKKISHLDTTVLIRRIGDYDREKIRRCIVEGMRFFGYQPAGRVFVKPNVVYATKGGRHGSTAYTDRTVLGGTLLALGESGATRVDVGEKTAIGYPTRLVYGYAGYYDEVRDAGKSSRADIGIFSIEEERRREVFLGGIVHHTLRIPEKMAAADSMVYLPKLKCHCVSSMTGAVKLNIGICSDDERSIHHDYLLDDKIVDLLAVGYPDFIVMDAIDVGVGNEAVPTPRRLGLLIMGRNPVAVDIVGAHLLGYEVKEVPYLKRAIERGYGPARLGDITLAGDITGLRDLNRAAAAILPRDDDFHRWQDIDHELKRLKSPLRFYWGHTSDHDKKKCHTGCIMGLKMFFGFVERLGGGECFAHSKPALIVVGRHDAAIDAAGADAFLIGSCASARITNARKILKIDRCYTTAVELSLILRGRLGLPAPLYDFSLTLPLAGKMLAASIMKLVKLRYFQDIWFFLKKGLMKRL